MKLHRIIGSGVMALLAGLSLAIELGGCSASQAAPQSVPAEATTGSSIPEFSGLWTGTIRVTPCGTGAVANAGPRCNAINNISFSLVESGSQLSGSYTCSTGTYICRAGGADNSGKIVSGKISGNKISIQIVISADVSNCYFNGTSQDQGTLTGVYTCYNGGQFIEQGMWQVSRE